MKRTNAIKSLTFTIEELCQLLAEHSANGDSNLTETIAEAAKSPESINTENAENGAARLVLDKIQAKAERLKSQREKRKLRKQQSSPKNPSTTSGTQKLTMTLTHERAQTLLWLHNHAEELKNRLTLLTKIASPLLPPTSSTTLLETLTLLSRLATYSRPQLQSFLSSPRHEARRIEVRIRV